VAVWRLVRRRPCGGEARRSKIVAAEGEYQAAVKLGQAADIITQHPVALQLRTLQTMAEISVEKNSTIIFPARFMTTVQEAFALMSKDAIGATESSRRKGYPLTFTTEPEGLPLAW
jgi:hypothetical protein